MMEVLRFIYYNRPASFLIENSGRLATYNNGTYINSIMVDLRRWDYHVHFKLVRTELWGIPQRRHRTYIVGIYTGDGV